VTVAGVPGRGKVVLGRLPAQLDTPTGMAWMGPGQLALTSPSENAILLIN
jgi:hypothetical protein